MDLKRKMGEFITSDSYEKAEKTCKRSKPSGINVSDILSISFINQENFKEALNQISDLCREISNRYEPKNLLILGQVDQNCGKYYADCVCIDYNLLNDLEKDFFDHMADYFETSYRISEREFEEKLLNDDLDIEFLRTKAYGLDRIFRFKKAHIEALNITPALIQRLLMYTENEDETEDEEFEIESEFCRCNHGILNMLVKFCKQYV